MAHAINTRANAPANALRDDLGRAERLIVSPSVENVEELLLLLDRIEWRFDELARNGVDLRPEKGRRQGLHGRISTRPGDLVRAARRAGGLSQLREKHAEHEQVDTTNFWWHLDATVANRRYLSLRRTSLIFGSIIGVLVLIYWALTTLFPPSPETLLLMDVNSKLDNLILNEQWADALAVVEQAREQAPDAPELLVWSAVFNERLGNDGVAQQRLARGLEVSTGPPADFWNLVGQLRLRAGDLAGAQVATQNVIDIDPENPEAYFLLASVAEAEGDVPRAIELFNRTFELAQEDNPQLAVISRVRLGTLLQQAGGNPFAAQENLTDSSTTTDSTILTPTGN